MEMVGVGMMELLLLLAGGGGLSANDLVSLVPLDDYFASRNITVNAKEMTTLAGKEPSDARTAVRQLLAIRWLGAERIAAR